MAKRSRKQKRAIHAKKRAKKNGWKGAKYFGEDYQKGEGFYQGEESAL